MLSAEYLDSQSAVVIDRWVDIDSEECRDIDDDPGFTKRILKQGFADPPFLFTDSLGRIWGRWSGEKFFPLHFEWGKKLIGYRIAKKAVN